MSELGIGANLNLVKADFLNDTQYTIKEAALSVDGIDWSQKGGKSGIHSEHLGFILADLQYMQRTYPQMNW